MGLLPSFGTKKRRRGPSKSGADMMAKEEARFLRELRKRNPNKYAEIMIGRMGFGGDNNDGELAKFAKTIGALKEITGVDFADVMGGGKDDLKGMLKDFAGTEVGAAVIGGLITRFMPGVVPGAQQSQVTVVEPAQPSQATIAEGPSNPQLQEPAKVSPSMECQLLLALFKNTPAEQAVAQLRAQNKPEINQFLDKLGQCNANDEVASVFREILALKPDLHDAIHWLATNPPYLAAVINSLKGSNTVQAPAPVAAEPAGERRKRPHGL